MNQQLELFYTHLNDAVITTNDFEEGTRFRKREKVHQFAYCGLNPVYRSYLSFDLDYPGAGRKFEELKIPVPSIITTNKANGHAHYLYRLITPVAYHDGGRSKPQEFFEAVEQEMTVQLKADPAFTHTLTKNPLHDRWIVESFSGQYHLSDFTEYFDLPSRYKPKALPETCEIRGRNDELFHTLRYWAYDAVHNHTNEEAWFVAVYHQAEIINSCFATPLGVNEVKATAKTLSKWVWKKRHELNVRPKVLQFTDETATERMQAGAAFTNQKRRDTSLIIVRAAYQELLPIYGSKLTPRILSGHTGQNIKTVRKYLALIISPNQ
jgi:hypothetical protein